MKLASMQPKFQERSLLLASLLALTLLFAAFTPLASAHQSRVFTGSFGAAASTVPNPYPLALKGTFRSGNAAVDEATGAVYVADIANNRVEKFDAEGHFLLMFGAGVNKSALETPGRESEEGICPAPGHLFDECQSGTATTAAGGLDEPVFIAVDNSNGPSSGDVYVTNAQAGEFLISKFDEDGHLVEGWGDNGPLGAPNGQLKGSAAPHGPFEEDPIAVDSAGKLLVFNGLHSASGALFLDVFSQGSSFLGETRLQESLLTLYPPAVDPEGDVFTVQNAGVLENAATGAWLRTFGSSLQSGPAFDSKSGLLLVRETATRVSGYLPASCPKFFCVPSSEYASPRLGGTTSVIVDGRAASDTLFAVQPGQGELRSFAVVTVPDVLTTAPTNAAPATATLNGTVNPDGVELTECFFEWGETTAYGEISPCQETPAEIGTGSAPVHVHAAVSGLQEGKTYHYRLVAANANDEAEPERGADFHFGPPLIDSRSVSNVTSSSALLEAEIDPQGAPTTYQFQYLTEAAYLEDGESFEGPAVPLLAPAAPKGLGSGQAAVPVTAPLAGLQAITAYRYRVLIGSVLGSAQGEAGRFITQSAGPLALPDSRGWELVSPPDKHGARLQPINELGVIQAAADGNAITYPASAPTGADPLGNANFTQVLSGRGPGGWSSQDLAVSHPQDVGLAITAAGTEYRFFSPDLSKGMFQPFGSFVPFSPEATQQTPYVHTNFAPGEPAVPCAAACYRPLVTEANVPPETVFGPSGECVPTAAEAGEGHPVWCGPEFVAATPSFDHFLISSHVALTATPLAKGGTGLYEWSAGELTLVSILPGASEKPAKFGIFAGRFAGAGSGNGGRNAFSVTGERVIFETGQELLLRDLTKGESIRLDEVQSGASGSGAVHPIFQAASPDDSKIFFTDEQRLTSDSGADNGKPDLYECQIVEVASKLSCTLTDLTPLNGAEPAAVQGRISGMSADGNTIFYVANAAYTSGSDPGSCADNAAPTNRCNLYRRHFDGSGWEPAELIAVLSQADRPDWAPASGGGLTELTARASPDGRWFAFMSQQPLTGYDNRDAHSGEPDEEVFLYHSGQSSEEGRLVCVSCNPTGGRPKGVEARGVSANHGGLVGGGSVWPGTTWLSANIPGWTPYATSVALYQSRFLSDGGRLFFNSAEALVPQDTNGTEDVYEYEPPQGPEEPSADSCTESSSTYSPASGGCVTLISSGTSPSESAFLDASETGDDVFFLTAARLGPSDVDTALDVYDARVGGGESAPVKPVECAGDSCQQPVAPPSDATPGSLTFNGTGNVTECPKGRQRKGGKCVKQKQAKKRHHKKPRSQRHTHTNRGGKK